MESALAAVLQFSPAELAGVQGRLEREKASRSEGSLLGWFGLSSAPAAAALDAGAGS